MRDASLSSASVPSVPDEHGLDAEPLAERAREIGDAVRRGAGDVHDVRVGRRRLRERGERERVRVALPDDVDVPHGQVDRLTACDAQREVDQHAVAEIDRVVEAHDRDRRADDVPRPRSKIRSRARQEKAYSPTGAAGSLSRDPPRAGA